MAAPIQAASVAAWNDEQHVMDNRAAYDTRYAAVVDTLGDAIDMSTPAGGFYLWPTLPLDDREFTKQLLAEQNVRIVPGSYLAREDQGQANPGTNRIRLALVAPGDDCMIAAQRIATCLSAS